ncbi:glycosyltransferase family 4 protein [Cellulomonas sp.]|uniref:glycosyltransferase family 4 protein n=1 Tax=Cellulomonas sp. TaxID=40001 RepID=UPI0025BC4815|nr:glycosyltransferase family 4 protein [Cellulomonas sp.]
MLRAAGTYDSGAHPRIRVLLEGLARRGWTVQEVVEPLRFDTRRRVEVLRRPSRLPAFGWALVRAWSRLGPRLVSARRGPAPDAVVVGHMGHFDVALVRALSPRCPVVLDYLISGAGTARDRGEQGRVKQRLLRALDRFALARADVVVVDTEEHAQALDPDARRRTVVVAVGADDRWFGARRNEAAEPDGGGRLRVVFYGVMTPLQGAGVVAEALRALDGAVDATIVGQGQDGELVDRLLADVPRIRRLPWVQPDDLPALVAEHDVCLGIFGDGEKARLVVPNKAFQGAAAGCVVVTGDTAPQRRAFGSAAVLVPPGDAAALAEALRQLASDPAELARRRSASRAWADAHFRPESVVAPLDERLRAR